MKENSTIAVFINREGKEYARTRLKGEMNLTNDQWENGFQFGQNEFGRGVSIIFIKSTHESIA